MITVVTASDTQQLTTTANLKALLGITDSTKDSLLSALIDRASIAISNFCGRNFTAETLLETIAASGRNQNIALSRFPIIAVSSVQYDGDDVDTDSYGLQEPENGWLFARYGWNNTFNEQLYAIGYSAGFKLPGQTIFPVGALPLPADLEAACLETAKVLYLERADNPNIYSESVPGVYSVTYHGRSGGSGGAGIIPDTALSTIQSYVNVRV